MSLPRAVRFTLAAVSALVQFGKGGPKIKANGAAFESRNAADSAFAVMRVATAVGASDAVPLAQLMGLIVGGSAIPGTIVWEPGGAAGQPSNVYVDATPAAALAAFQALAGDKVFMISDRAAPDAVALPADFVLDAMASNGRATLAGIGLGSTPTLLTCEQGSTIVGFNEFRRLRVFNNATGAPPIVFVDGQILDLTEGTSIANPALENAIYVPFGVHARIVLHDLCTISGQPSTDVAPGAALEFIMYDSSSLQNETLGGSGTLSIYAVDSAITNSQGSAYINLLSEAEAVRYRDDNPSIRANNVKTAIVRLRDSRSEIVWQPGGGGNAGGNIYTENLPSSALIAFAQLSGDRTFTIDDTFAGGPIVLPAGAFNAGTNPGRTTLAGRSQGAAGPRVSLTFGGGATLSGWNEFRDLTLVSTSIGDVCQLNDNDRISFRNCQLSNSSGPTIFRCVGNAVACLYDTSYVEDAGHPVFLTSGAGSLSIFLFDRVSLENNVVATAGGTTATVIQASNGTTANTQGAGVTISIEASAGQTSYFAGNPSDWNGTAPMDVNSAIDRLAAAVAILVGSPIP